MSTIRVAIAGIGSCCSALVQGIYYYRNRTDEKTVGLMNPIFGGYALDDIEFVAAFDVNRDKIGKDLSDAIFAEPSQSVKFSDCEKSNVEVVPGPVFDGVAPHMREEFRVYDEVKTKTVNVAEHLREARADMLINYLPVGSLKATQFYAQSCIDAGCAFVNGIPEFIASDPEWAKKFKKAGLPVAGDDIKSQLGATIVHRALVELLQMRGLKLDATYQLNLGGNTDFLNMTREERLASKRISKTEAVTSLLSYKVPTRIGPSGYVRFLGDTKVCYIHIGAKNFGGQPIELDVKLKVEDSPNSAGVMVDVIRATKIALDRKIAGPLISISAYSFKHPPVSISDHIARTWVEEYIRAERPN